MSDNECGARIRDQYLSQHEDSEGLEIGLLHRMATEIAEQYGLTLLKAHRLAWRTGRILAVLAAGAGFLLHLAQQSRRTLCTYIRMCKTGISHASDCIRHRRRSTSRCGTSANAHYAANECESAVRGRTLWPSSAVGSRAELVLTGFALPGIILSQVLPGLR